MALYGFLAWALIVLWQDMRRQSQLLVVRQPPF